MERPLHWSAVAARATRVNKRRAEKIESRRKERTPVIVVQLARVWYADGTAIVGLSKRVLKGGKWSSDSSPTVA